jgi:hypothetical protein
MVHEPDTSKKNRKKLHVQATRQSLRLRNQGGIPVEKMAARKKQKQNLDYSGTKNLNPFVLNSMDDDVLLQRTKDLDLRLAEDDVSSKLIITAIKAEEQLCAAFVEAEYQAHLDSLKHKECIQDDDDQKMNIIDNSQRGCSSPLTHILRIVKSK